jgi:hypothetical protein
MGTATEPTQLAREEERLVAVAPGEKERALPDRSHARQLDRRPVLRPSLRLTLVAGTLMTEVTEGQDAVVTVTPIDPDGIPADLANPPDAERGHATEYHAISILDSTGAGGEDAGMRRRGWGWVLAVAGLTATIAVPAGADTIGTETAPARAAAPSAIAGSRAGDYVGQEVTIEGRVTAIHESPLATVLAFAQNFAGFTATILASDREKFPVDLEGRVRDKVVRVTGTVTAYRGKPEMALRDPSQLVLASPAPGSVGAVPPPAPVVSPEGPLEDIRRTLLRLEQRMESIETRLEDVEEDAAAAATAAQQAERRGRSLTLGATADEVRRLLGEPAVIGRAPSGDPQWGYGRGRLVTFDTAGRVIGWSGF